MKNLQKYGVIFFALFVLCAAAQVSVAEEAKKPAEAPKEAVKEAEKAPAKEPAKEANEMVEKGWQTRCTEVKDEKKSDKKQCEVFQRIEMKDSHMLVAEFAIGFPHEKDLEKGAARGVAVLPLGIMLPSGVGLKVDDEKPVVFNPRFCTNAGCFSFLTLNKDLVASMKKGKTVAFQFKALQNQDVNIVMHMNGFEKLLKEIQ